MSKKIWVAVVIGIMVVGGAAVLVHKEGRVFDERFLALDGRRISPDTVVKTVEHDRDLFSRRVGVTVERDGLKVLDLEGVARLGWGVSMDLRETAESRLNELMKERGLKDFNATLKVKASPVGGKIKLVWDIDPVAYERRGLVCRFPASILQASLSGGSSEILFKAPSVECTYLGNPFTVSSPVFKAQTNLKRRNVARDGSIELHAGPVTGEVKGYGKWSVKSLEGAKKLDLIEGSPDKNPLYLSHILWKLEDLEVEGRGSISTVTGDVYVDRFPGRLLDSVVRRPVDDPGCISIAREAYEKGGMKLIVRNVDVESHGKHSFFNGTLEATGLPGRARDAGTFHLSINPKSWTGFPELKENLDAMADIGTLFYKEGIYSAVLQFGPEGVLMNGRAIR